MKLSAASERNGNHDKLSDGVQMRTQTKVNWKWACGTKNGGSMKKTIRVETKQKCWSLVEDITYAAVPDGTGALTAV